MRRLFYCDKTLGNPFAIVCYCMKKQSETAENLTVSKSGNFAAFEAFASKSCLLLFATGAEKGSFWAFWAVRKPPAPDRRKSQKTSLKPLRKSSKSCLLLCLLRIFCVSLIVAFTPKTRENHNILWLFVWSC